MKANKPKTALYRAPTFTLLASNGGLVLSETVLYRVQKQRCTELPLFLFLRQCCTEFRNSAVQSSHFFSSPCVTWWISSVRNSAVQSSHFFSSPCVTWWINSARNSTVQSSHFFSSPCRHMVDYFCQKQLCTELPLFLFSLHHMVD